MTVWHVNFHIKIVDCVSLLDCSNIIIIINNNHFISFYALRENMYVTESVLNLEPYFYKLQTGINI